MDTIFNLTTFGSSIVTMLFILLGFILFVIGITRLFTAKNDEKRIKSGKKFLIIGCIMGVVFLVVFFGSIFLKSLLLSKICPRELEDPSGGIRGDCILWKP